MTDWDLISSYAGLFTLAVGSVYAGAFGSLPTRRPKGANDGGGGGEEEEDIIERISTTDAWTFPIVGSGVLVGLYVVVKYFGTEWINWLLGLYFSATGVLSVWKSLVSLTKCVLGLDRWKSFDRCRVIIRKANTEFSIFWRTPTLFLFPLGAIPSILYAAGCKSTLLTDILALSFAHSALSWLRIDSFKTGCILLSGLFIYDIWWVFGTNVMVDVATTLDIPIKLLWPKSLNFSGARGFTMLGLGDIIVPGTFIALALRYDYHRSVTSHEGASFRKPYFHTSLGAYIVGLVVTIVVMHTFQSAQPALLYLSPACILSFVCTALVLGDFKAAWEWNDEAQSAVCAEQKEKLH